MVSVDKSNNSQGKTTTMSTINTNVSSLVAQNALRQNNDALQTSLTRLSTGLKINTGEDDPSGLIAANALKDQQAGINTAISNAQQANNVIGTAAGGLTEVSSLLTELQSLLSQTANNGGLSATQISANQQQVDSILSTINRVAGSTQFSGKQLLNGNYAYTTSSTGTSAFASIQVNAAQLTDNATTAVVVQVTNSATAAQVVNTQTTSALGAAVSLQIAGASGTTQLSFASGTKLSAVAAAFNTIKSVTGVSAHNSGATLKLDSTGYGSSQYVSVTATSGTFTTTGGTSGKAYGTDATVTVNGAAATTSGKNVTYSSNNLQVQFTLSSALNGGKTKTFGITGGGANFALGEQVDNTDNASIGIQAVTTGSLGDVTNGFLSSLGSGGANSLTSGNLTTAQNVLSEAINQVSTLSGRLGAFQKYTLGSTINNLSVAYENASSALSNVEDTDFAAETANLTRAQILASSATTVLSTANSQPQNVLKLLG
jgi:flagellin